MYRMASVGALVVSSSRVVTAIAFQSEMTAGSSAAGAAAVAVPVVRVVKRAVARDQDQRSSGLHLNRPPFVPSAPRQAGERLILNVARDRNVTLA
jgi:hypothetical protein